MTHTATDVAVWMLDELSKVRYLYQETAVWDIASRFGQEFVYDNAAGNLAISKDVLAEFTALTGERVVWQRGERVWRFRESYDAPGRQQE